MERKTIILYYKNKIQNFAYFMILIVDETSVIKSP